MRVPRPAARILLVDGRDRVLLFRFTPADGRAPFWCTPGGAVDGAEGYGQAARRELLEETGIDVDPNETYPDAARRELLEEVGLDRDPGPEVAQRTVEFLTIERVEVVADERWFRVDVDTCDVDAAGHTDLERAVMKSWRWFTRDDLAAETEAVYPDDLAAMLDATARSRP